MKMRTLGLVGAGLAGLFLAASAQAAMESFSHTTPSQAVPLSDSFFIQGFDPSLGTLTGVTLELDTNATAEVDVINFTAAAEPFTDATAAIPVTITGPGPTTVTDTLMAGPTSGTSNPGLFVTTAFPGLTGTQSDSTSVLPANFAPYIGVGLIVPVTAAANDGFYSGTGTEIGFGGSAVAGATTTVTYTYTTAVPEPTSISLIALALPLLASRRRKA